TYSTVTPRVESYAMVPPFGGTVPATVRNVHAPVAPFNSHVSLPTPPLEGPPKLTTTPRAESYAATWLAVGKSRDHIGTCAPAGAPRANSPTRSATPAITREV